MTPDEKTKAFKTLVDLKENTSVVVPGFEGEDFTEHDGYYGE